MSWFTGDADPVNPQLSQQQKRLQQFIDHERLPPARPPTHVTNDVSDITGAKPVLKNYMCIHRPHFHDTQDIQGSGSKELHPKHRRVGSDDRFKQLPIEGTSPQPSGFRTNRVCNPMDPNYHLPSFKEAPPILPKFLRDSYNVSDIEGTSFKKKLIDHPRETMRLDDIPGSQAGWIPVYKRPLREHGPRDILNVSDITHGDFKSTRVTNVLAPVYTVNGMTYQDDILSHPKALHPKRNKPMFSLETQDIQGACAKDTSKSIINGIAMDQRREFRSTNRVNDIVGAQADTVIHSIKSTRRVDPNWPEYHVLDGAKVDSSAMSTAKSIVFADFIKQHDVEWHREEKGPYVVSGVANVGMTGTSGSKKDKHLPVPTRRSTAPATLIMTTGRISQERKQAEDRQKEIQLVRELK